MIWLQAILTAALYNIFFKQINSGIFSLPWNAKHTEGNQEEELKDISFPSQCFRLGELIQWSSQAQQKGECMWHEPKTNSTMETNFYQLSGALIISQPISQDTDLSEGVCVQRASVSMQRECMSVQCVWGERQLTVTVATTWSICKWAEFYFHSFLLLKTGFSLT